ncbi:Arc family DNA-binding protein [Pantoea eucrina]|uniref:Arc family DNA-binding protein n=1 Tax=Pantoea eucrina TaxID=472693 RepID=A0ABU5LDM0_9GAMM|nr:Arc family DNA-binding protein [Pantoea eucrina]MDZ7278049.1 Arc family DNA-binding protein [Pantoea eucrina]
MTETVNLTIKIDPALKEQIKQLAADHHISMSQEIVNRLQASLDTVEQPDVDSLHTEESVTDQLTASELKQIRLLLKKNRKKKS